MNRHSNRVAALERQRAAATPAADAFTLADWQREHEAHRGETTDEWLARMRANVGRWPADRQADMLQVWTQTAETLKMMEQMEAQHGD
jgi:hypothetical protein